MQRARRSGMVSEDRRDLPIVIRNLIRKEEPSLLHNLYEMIDLVIVLSSSRYILTMKALEKEAYRMKHFVKLAVVSTALLVGAPLVTAHLTPSRASGTSGKTLAFAQSLNITPQAADAIAVTKVGHGSVIKTSLDTYQGQKVYDIHVRSTATTKIWDIKVSVANGTVVMARLASEQAPSTAHSAPKSDTSKPSESKTTSPEATKASTPTTPSTPSGAPVSSTTAETTAIHAVGGGTIQHVSNDTYQGVAVYDIHVLLNGTRYDVKVSQSTGAVLQKKVSQESQSSASESSKPASQPSKDAPDKKSSSSSATGTPAPSGGIVFNQKLSTVPAAYQSAVTSAISQVGGGSLKWVKFITKSSGDIEMNVKIHLATKGTIKVKDIFSSNGQLLSQSLNS